MLIPDCAHSKTQGTLQPHKARKISPPSQGRKSKFGHGKSAGTKYTGRSMHRIGLHQHGEAQLFASPRRCLKRVRAAQNGRGVLHSGEAAMADRPTYPTDLSDADLKTSYPVLSNLRDHALRDGRMRPWNDGSTSHASGGCSVGTAIIGGASIWTGSTGGSRRRRPAPAAA